MDTVITNKKKAMIMMMLFFFVYFASYMTRNSFGAVLEGIRKAEGYEKSALGVVTAMSFITYGAGQIISGFFGDKIQPKLLLVAGLLLSCVMNVLIPFVPSTTTMAVLWGINGFAQAFVWPPIVKILVAIFDKDNYDKAIVIVSWGGMVGTIANYLVSFLFVSVLTWKYVFFFTALVGVIVSVIVIFNCPTVQIVKKVKGEFKDTITNDKKDTKWFSFTVVVLMLCIVLQGSLRDGISTWMPTFINDEFNLGDNISILTGVLMPLLGIVFFVIASKLHKGKFKNPVSCAGVIFVPASVCAAFLILPVLFGLNIGTVPTIVAMAVLTGCTHGINMMLVAIVPRHFAYTGKVSLISGVLNAFTYIGSAISIYGYPLIQEAGGLGAVKIVWAVTAILGLTLCLALSKSFKKKYIDR